MIKKLTDKHLNKLVIVTGLPLSTVTELVDMGLIDLNGAVNQLIKYDWKLLRARANNISQRHRILALVQEYGVTEYRVRQCVYERPKPLYVCNHCGTEIPKAEYLRNQGQCDKCIVKSINV